MGEDFNKLRAIARRLVRTHFREPWQFRLEIESYPYDDFDILVREITYGPTEVETEQLLVGAKILTLPKSCQPVTLSVTVREHSDERVSKWFDGQVAKIFNKDGTINLPYQYLLKARRFPIKHDMHEAAPDEWDMIPTQRGDVTEAKDGEGVSEFPLTFIQFRS